MYILAGDVGGTKTILALYHNTDGHRWETHSREIFASRDFGYFDHLLDTFMARHADLQLSAACIGVAGQIIDGDCLTTNLPWELKYVDIAKRLQTPKIKLLNDLEATAWGVLNCSADELVDLNPEAIDGIAGNIAVIAAGTGLGEAMLIWDGGKHHVIATEGGHADFAPNDNQQDDLLGYLRKKLSGHVSYERAISGQGLISIYNFLKDTGFAQESIAVREHMNQRDPAAVIGEFGVQREDALCTEALRIFCSLYGAETGNLALKCLPYAGIFLAGGIATKILPAIQRGDFLKGYLDKGRFSQTLARIPLKVCLNQDVALLGAARYAQNMI